MAPWCKRYLTDFEQTTALVLGEFFRRELVATGLSKKKLALRYGLNEDSLKRILTKAFEDLPAGRLKEMNRDDAGRFLETAIVNELQINPSGLALDDLREALISRDDPAYKSAKRYKVALDGTLNGMIDKGLVTCVEGRYIVAEHAAEFMKTDLPTQQAKRLANASSCRRFIDAVILYNGMVKDGVDKFKLTTHFDARIAVDDDIAALIEEIWEAVRNVLIKYEARIRARRQSGERVVTLAVSVPLAFLIPSLLQLVHSAR